MKKVKAWWGVGRDMDEDVMEFSDDATDEEIEEAVREYVMGYFDWGWEEAKND